MDTEFLSEKLSALLDGELSEGERQELEALIASNPAVAREWHALNRMDRLFREMPRHDAPHDLTARLRAPRAVRRTVSFGRPRSSRRSAWPLLAAAAAFVFMFGLFLLRIPKPDTITLTRLDSVPAESRSGHVSGQEEKACSAAAENRGPSPAAADDHWGEFGVVPRQEIAAPMAAPAPAAGMRKREDAPQMQAGEAPAPTEAPEFLGGLGLEKGLAGGAASGARSPSPRGAADANEAHVEQKMGAVAGMRPQSSESDQAGALTRGAAPPPPPAAQAAPAIEGVNAEITDGSETQHTGDRVFQLRDSIWVQDGYSEQAITAIERDSDEWAALIDADPTLAWIMRLQEAVVFESAGAWYRIPPAMAAEQSDTPAQP